MEINDPFNYSPRQLSSLERTRFFPRQLVTPDDLLQDQIYFREQQRLRNQFLNRWGIVGGATVKQGAKPCEVIVDRGYIVDPLGYEIFILQPTTVNLCHVCRQHLNQHLEITSPEGMNPSSCNFSPIQDVPKDPLYLTIHYAEYLTCPIQVASTDCSCPATKCEYTRIREGYYFRASTSLPKSYNATQPSNSSSAEDNGVVLAKITLGNEHIVSPIDNSDRRNAIDQIQRIQRGSQLVSPRTGFVRQSLSSNHYLDCTVKFSESFFHPPQVFATTRQKADNNSETFAVTIRTVTKDSFTARVCRVDLQKSKPWSNQLYLDWIAYE
jgi:hypothetical protein